MNTRLYAVIAGVVVVLLVLAYTMLFTVNQVEQGLLLQFGRPIRPIDQAGLHFKLPYQDVVLYDRRVLDFEPPAEEVIASDQKRLVVDAYIRFRIADPLQFYQSVGTEPVARARLGTLVNGSLRRVIGNVELQAVVSDKRAAIMQQVRDEVNAQAKSLGIDIIDVRIRHADLPEENSQAVFDRMKSDRQRVEILADAQKQSQILRGQGDSESIKDYADAYNKDKNFFAFYRSLDAYRLGLSGQNTTLVLSPQDDFFKYLQSGPTGVTGPASSAR
jgi:membrane protease subunit HflC